MPLLNLLEATKSIVSPNFGETRRVTSHLTPDGFWISFTAEDNKDPYDQFDGETYVAKIDLYSEGLSPLKLANTKRMDYEFLEVTSDTIIALRSYHDNGWLYQFDTFDNTGKNLETKIYQHSEPEKSMGFLDIFHFNESDYFIGRTNYFPGLTNDFTTASDTKEIITLGDPNDGAGDVYLFARLNHEEHIIEAPLAIINHQSTMGLGSGLVKNGSNIYFASSEYTNWSRPNADGDHISLTTYDFETGVATSNLIYSVQQDDAIIDVRIKKYNDDKLIFFWSENYKDGSLWGAYYGIFDISTSEFSGPFLATSITEGSQYIYDLEIIDERLLILFNTNDLDGSRSGVFFQEADIYGNLIGDYHQINDYTTGHQSDATIKATNGHVLVTWRNHITDEADYATFKHHSSNTLIYNSNASSEVYGTSSADLFDLSDASEKVHGGLGNDVIYGKSGDDILIGEEGDDTLVGGSGNDTFKFAKIDSGTTGHDRVLDFEKTEDAIETTGYTTIKKTLDAFGHDHFIFEEDNGESSVTIENTEIASTLKLQNLLSATVNISNSSFAIDTGGEIDVTKEITFSELKINESGSFKSSLKIKTDTAVTDPINLSDVLVQLKHIIGLKQLKANALEAGDCNNDGIVDLSDVLANLKHIIGLKEIDTFDLVTNNGFAINALSPESAGTLTLVINGDADQSHADWELI